MNRLRVKAGKGAPVVAAFACAAFAGVVPAAAQTTANQNFWFSGTRLVFAHAQTRGGEVAIATDDDGLMRFLAKLNATLAYQPGQKYIVVTGPDRSTVAFTIGDIRYRAGGVAQNAPFAPYVSGGAAYLPFAALARALAVDAVDDAGMTVLQPQIASLDVRAGNKVTVVTLRGATPLRFKRTSNPNDDRLSLTFLGSGSTLAHERDVATGNVKSVTITPGGSPKNPTTVFDFDAIPGTAHVLAPSDSPNSLSIAFAPAGAALGGTQIPEQGDANVANVPLLVRYPPLATGQTAATNVVPPAPPPVATVASGAPAPAALAPGADAGALPLATVVGFDTETTDGGLNVKLSIAGNVRYEWHRLPDNRWYVDLKPAALAVTPQDMTFRNPSVEALRIKGFVGPNDRQQTVRLALTLTSPRAVNLVASDGGVTVSVDKADDPAPQRVGFGQVQDGRVVAALGQPPPPVRAAVPTPVPEAASDPGTSAIPAPTWKFAPHAGINRKLIVIDAGHGGSDSGAVHNGLAEKDLNLDLSKRLRTVLVARGWQVKMTRDSDVDVFAPNDSAHDELQARDDVANAAGAALFISIHINAFTSSGLSGTTTYYYKGDSYGLAGAVHARLAANLPTKDDGLRKENFYVIRHAAMPAILVETAFLSNSGDADLLRSPEFLQKVVLSIADGVGDYASQTPVSSNVAPSDGL
ncbi:MAG: N-acetylmuramoyl-L-alanine amidase [Candidatus Eremiobacteraeota bacterium]|nr:N-acetylmuramoyl-L-alanine amidase [Candidatus Eremiobacteraeota bacterium]